MTETTPSFALPLLHVGQAGKELTHNEALVLIDALLRGRAEAVANDPPAIAAPVPGQLWIVGDAAVGDWAAQDGRLALMTDGGWRFLAPADGMVLYLASESCLVRYDGSWQLAPEIAAIVPSDSEDAGARAQLAALLAALADRGFVRLPA